MSSDNSSLSNNPLSNNPLSKNSLPDLEDNSEELYKISWISTVVRRYVWTLDDGSKLWVDSCSIDDAINILIQVHQSCHQLLEAKQRLDQTEEESDASALKVLGLTLTDISPSFITIPENQVFDYFYHRSLVLLSIPASFGFQRDRD
jgi:hypothetical protein